jgi:hypothetical protein
MKTLSFLTLIALFLVAGCDQSPVDVPQTDTLAELPAIKSNSDSGTYTIVVEDAGFVLPESALHHETMDVYLVSNLGVPDETGNPLALNNNGFISMVSPDGVVLELKWIEGGVNDVTLHSPTGIAMWKGNLYVTDRNAIRIFDGETGSPLDMIPMEGVYLLNDICFAPNGDLFATETGLEFDENEGDLVPTGTDAVYRIRNGTVTKIASGAELAGPNGCVALGGNVVVASFFSNELYRINTSGKIFPVAAMSGGGIDGIVRINGSYFVTSWGSSAVLKTTIGGSMEATVLPEIETPADLGYDALRNRLLIPQLFENKLVIHNLD